MAIAFLAINGFPDWCEDDDEADASLLLLVTLFEAAINSPNICSIAWSSSAFIGVLDIPAVLLLPLALALLILPPLLLLLLLVVLNEKLVLPIPPAPLD